MVAAGAMRPGPALLFLGLGLGLGLGHLSAPSTPPNAPPESWGRVPPRGELVLPQRPGGAGAPRPARAPTPRAPPLRARLRRPRLLGSAPPRGSRAPQILQNCQIQNLKITSDRGQSPLVLNHMLNATLDANVRVRCPKAQARRQGWQVLALESLGDPHHWHRALKLNLQTGSQPWVLLIPGHFLRPGLYAFNFSLSLLNARGARVSASDCFYITFVRSPLQAVLEGPQQLTIQFTDQLVLNGSRSSDPDAGKNPYDGMQFAWYCATDRALLRHPQPVPTKKRLCLPEQVSLLWSDHQGAVLTLPPRTLRGGSIYYFRMVVQKANRSAFSEKTVQVELGPQPPTSITCLENCGHLLLVSDVFSLFVNCTQCTPRDMYRWYFLSGAGREVPFDWGAHTSTGRGGAYLSLRAFALRAFPEEDYQMRVHLTTWGGREVSLGHAFTLNQPPQAGECLVHPAEGSTLLTDFVIRCRGFWDKDTPLTYKIIVSDLHGVGTISSLRENTLGAVLYLGHEPTVPTSFLPPGDATNRDSLKLYAQVSDSWGAFSQVAFHATVHAPTHTISSHSLLERLGNLTAVPAHDLGVVALVSNKSLEVAGYLFYLVASMLESLQAAEDYEAQRLKLYQDLIYQAVLLPLNTVEEVSQVVMLLVRVSERAKELPRLLQIQALVRTWQVSKALKAQRGSPGFQTEQVKSICTGILTTLSNLLSHMSLYEVAEEPMFVLQGLVDAILSVQLPSNETIALRSSNINIYIRKTLKWNISGICQDDDAGLACFDPRLSSTSVQGLPDNSPVSMSFCTFASDPFPWLNHSGLGSVQVSGYQMTSAMENGNQVVILPDVAHMLLVRKNRSVGLFRLTVGPESTFQAATEPGKATSGAFSFEVDSTSQEVLVYIVTDVEVFFVVSLYAGHKVSAEALVAIFLVPPRIPPVANRTDHFDPACPVKSAQVLCLSSSLLQLVANRSPKDQARLTVLLEAPHFVSRTTDRLVNVSVLRLLCLDMYEDYAEWREHTCVLGPHTTWEHVHCVCRAHPARSRRQFSVFRNDNLQLNLHFLSSRVLVPPNFVDLRLEVIKNIPQNPVTLLTVLCIMLLYVVFAFWALHRDETDQYLRDNVIVLPDNSPYDNVCYLLTVFTGSRWGAGTRADVFVELRGTERASDVHCLSHPQVRALYRGSINTFLLTTHSDLGDLRSIRVWHNNEGHAPSWYLSRIKVESLFSRHIWLFMCRTWLSVDGALDRTFYPMLPDDALGRKDYFLIDCVHSLGNDHSWFSVFSGVVGNSFNRLQRLSCCLAMLLSSLLCNIMYFNLDSEDHEGEEHGDLAYVHSMVIGMQSCLITLPVQLLITALFTYSQKRPQATLEEVAPRTGPLSTEGSGHWEERLAAWHNKEASKKFPQKGRLHTKPVQAKDKKGQQETMSSTAQHPGQANRNTNAQKGPPQRPDAAKPRHPDLRPAKEKPPIVLDSLQPDPESPEQKPRLVLPWWCVLAAWFLVFATCSVSSSFIVFYGLTYGYEKSVEWLFASFCAFCQSVLLVQPIKIILATSYRTNQAKYCKNLPWTSNYQYTEIKLRARRLSAEEAKVLHRKLAALRRSRMYQPLTQDEIRIFQRKKRVRRRALLFLGYVLSHVTFLALLLVLVAVLGHARSFYYNRFVRDHFSVGLENVSRLGDVYQWLHRVPLPLFHNSQRPAFLPHSSARILGLPLMRQVRAKPRNKLCPPARKLEPGRIKGQIHCRPEYGVDHEDTQNYSSAWSFVSSREQEGFWYKPPEKGWGYAVFGRLHTYGSGGYAFYFYPEELRANSSMRLTELQKGQWLDKWTWAVILEMTTFNPDAGLFCCLSVVFEVSPLGPVNASLALHSFALANFSHATSAEVYLYVAILIFFVAYMLDEVYVASQERAAYLRSIYNWLNLALKCMFAVGVSLFMWKHVLARRLIRAHLANPWTFVPFQAVSQLDHTLRDILGFLIFLTILKSLRYSRVFYTVRLAQRAIQTAVPAISHMALIVSVYFFVYVAFGYLVFGQHAWHYSSLPHATQTVFSYCVSAFPDTEFFGDRALGLLFLSSFLLVMVCVLINLFQAVILSAYEGMKQHVYEEPSDEAEAMTYLCRKLRAALALVLCQPEGAGQREPEFLMEMVYGQPLKRSRRLLGLKTRSVNGKKMVYLVV